MKTSSDSSEQIDQEALLKYEQELAKPVSKLLFLKIFAALIFISFVGVFGYFAFQEHAKGGGSEFVLQQKSIPDFQIYSNDNWGFSLQYPGSWHEAVGSVKDGEYYFSSQNLNFVEELEPGQALLTVKTYNNYANLGFEDWLAKQEQADYNPGEIILKEAADFNGLQAKHYLIKPTHPKNGAAYIDELAISKNQKTKLLISLVTDSEETHSQFQNTFNAVENSLKFYPGLEEK